MNSLNIVNVTKYINVNMQTSFIYVISRNHCQVCNDLLNNEYQNYPK